ncbi:tectonic-3 [Elysia marginata]|uniref:Tectonic-3 n=1 Tax=Elysia marginata TaxID=1093978 RepID=A0AAV4GEN2_9GAST|nr:tectonic-3 [Elysia marginata]
MVGNTLAFLILGFFLGISVLVERVLTQTQIDVGLCPCDLTGNGCDVNCCCDPDCSDADKLVFSECLSNSYLLDDKLCFDRDVFFSENGPARSGDSGNLFCIYFDNDEQRNYYTNQTVITTEADFLAYAAKTRTFSFQSPTDPLTVSSFEPYYKSGDPIYTVFPNGHFSYLGLPTPMTVSSACADSNPTAFYIDHSSSCGRFLGDLATDCGTADFLRASTYFQDFRIVKDPFLLQVFNSTTTLVNPLLGPVDLSDVTELYNNSYTAAFQLETPLQCQINGVLGPCSFTDVPAAPTYDSVTGTCTNALSGVHYRFETNGAFGVDRAFVRFTFADITSSSLTQTFSASFSSVGIFVLKHGQVTSTVGSI